MNIRWSDLIAFMVIVAASYGLYMVKWEVHELKRQNNEVQMHIAEQKDALNILDAEWAYLNRPERLRGLAEKYLTLEPEAGAQMVSMARLMEVPESLDSEVQTAEEEGLIAGAHLASASSTQKQGF
jgi:cell division protein FtsL